MNTLLELVDQRTQIVGVCRNPTRRREVFLEEQIRDAGRLPVLFAALVGMPFLAMIYPPALISRELHLFVFSAGMSASGCT